MKDFKNGFQLGIVIAALLFFTVFWVAVANSATLYLTTGGTGTRGAGCLTSNPCPLTPTWINANVIPGDTLLIKNGVHNCGACLGQGPGGAANGVTVNGTADSRITIQCETFNTGYPSQSGPGCTLNGNGQDDSVFWLHASFWIIQGIYFHNIDYDPGEVNSLGSLLWVQGSNNIVRKSIFSGVNTWQNSEMIMIATIGGNCGNLIEENDIMRSHRNMLLAYSSSTSIPERTICASNPNLMRLNHVSNGLPREPHGGYTIQALGPPDGIVDYTAGYTIWENNVVDSVYGECSNGGGYYSRHYGAIFMNCGNNAFVASSSGYGPSPGYTLKDILIVNAYQGMWLRSDSNSGVPWLVENVTIAGALNPNGWALIATNVLDHDAGALPDGPPGVTASNILDIATGGGEVGLENPGSFCSPASTCRGLSNSFSNTGSYTNWALTNTPPTGMTSASMNSCVAYVPSTAGGFGKGTNGGNVGADVTHVYQNEVKTGITRFDFNPATYGTAVNRGRDKYGPGIINGVNDASIGHTRANLHTALGFGSGGCPSPTGVTNVTITIVTPTTAATYPTPPATYNNTNINIGGTSSLP